MTCVERIAAGAVRGARCSLAGLGFAGLILLAPGHAAAADMDWLRGSFTSPFSSSSYSQWDGLNFGVHIGVGSMSTDFGNSTGDLVAFMLRNSTLEAQASPSSWTVLPNDLTNSMSYGLFLGYNYQMEQLVLGLDGTYTRLNSMTAQVADSITRIVTVDGNPNTVTIDANSQNKLIDYATLRVRAGYAFGQFQPYAFVGGAVGRFNYAVNATVTDVVSIGGVPQPPVVFSGSNAKDNAIVGGFTLGLGLDVAILPNVFLRGEWEYVGFAQVNGIRSTINSGKIGLGVRF